MGIYSPKTNLPVGSRKGQNALPVDRPTVIFLTVVPAVDRPVDRPPPESGVLSVGRPPGRPAEVAGLCARPVHIGQP